ncbi:hypothetical protein PBY51_020812 [Eleginops maclovinus]|uniref:BED-type domain-containing protein n=1 Tax=Eleginops maclovinus TaxID=56733 RepID=A0AAN8ATH3_ELEMC|nr:hypothetical protein PBY51_020812 [Eleginops maclovinus]
MSSVWSFSKMYEEDPHYAVCNDCEGRVMRGAVRVKLFNTTNLMTHLKNKHPEAYKEYEKLANANKQRKKATAATPVGNPIEQALEKTKNFHKKHLKQKALSMATTKMIAVDDQPFSAVEDEGFSEVIEVAEHKIRNHFLRATLLLGNNPRYKHRYFDADFKQVAKNKLEKEVNNMTASATTSASATDEPTPDAEDAEPEEKRMCTPSEGHSFLDMFDEILEEKEQDEQV